MVKAMVSDDVVVPPVVSFNTGLGCGDLLGHSALCLLAGFGAYIKLR